MLKMPNPHTAVGPQNRQGLPTSACERARRTMDEPTWRLVTGLVVLARRYS
ncbi:MAG: hypothetical protein K0Q46_5742 [Rhodococcus erythropolis]|nr:hypothetical protein [Rhodococcus erythropolis]